MEPHLFFEHASLFWAAPFVIFLGALALFPILAPQFWHTYDLWIVMGFCAVLIVPMTFFLGMNSAYDLIHNTLSHHYVPFVVLLSALFVVCGGIHITSTGTLSPLGNTLFLGVGSLLSSVIGTTGASMLLIRPFLALNHNRYGRKHLVIFFILTISNIGGMLTPIGDPPLFLGFLNGVDFFWPLRFLSEEFLIILLPLLCLFYAVDRHFLKKHQKHGDNTRRALLPQGVQIYGKWNFLFLIAIVGAVIASGVYPTVFARLRDLLLITICLSAYLLTAPSVRYMNRFSFEPLREVALVFLAIFMTLIPIEGMLHAGDKGPLSFITALAHPGGVPDPLRYYSLCGMLSAFLDNAPTYLLFFHMSGGDASLLMTIHHPLLQAISISSVAFGAMTYIGNAPNLMVKAIAERQNIKMPTFFGYMGWTIIFLMPILGALGLFYFG